MRIQDNLTNEDMIEYCININRALSSYSAQEILKMKKFVEQKQKVL